MQFDHPAKLLLAVGLVGPARADQAVGQHPKGDRKRAEDNDDKPHRGRDEKRVFVGMVQRIGLWHDLGEDDQDHGHGDCRPQHAGIIED